MQRISNENSNYFLQYNDMTVVAARERTLISELIVKYYQKPLSAFIKHLVIILKYV